MGNLFTKSTPQQPTATGSDESKAKAADTKKAEDEGVSESQATTAECSASQPLPETEEKPFQEGQAVEVGQEAVKLDSDAADEKPVVEEKPAHDVGVKSIPFSELTLEAMQMSVAEAALSKPAEEPVAELEVKLAELTVESVPEPEQKEEPQEPTPDIKAESDPVDVAPEANVTEPTREELIHESESTRPVEEPQEPEHTVHQELPDLVTAASEESTPDVLTNEPTGETSHEFGSEVVQADV